MPPKTFSPLVDQLIDSFCCLPGIGPKSAQRMVFYLLERSRANGVKLSQCLSHAMQSVKHCVQCRNFTENELCRFCADTRRHAGFLCVVETPLDVLAIEQTGCFNGYYFVLQGRLSPLDGIGPQEIGLDALITRVKTQRPEEIILATNATVEGEITAHHIAKLLTSLSLNIKFSRIAHGVHMGSELEYVDGKTLAYSIDKRQPFMD